MTPDDFRTLNDLEIIGLGANFKLLSDDNLMAIQSTVANLKKWCYHDAQITAITPEQIVLLTPARVRLLGIGYPRPTVAPPAKLEYLNEKTFRTLVADSHQAAAFTAEEVASLSSDRIPMFADNIAVLSNDALAALTYLFTSSPHSLTSQIGAVTAKQIAVLSPAQVRYLGISQGAKVAKVANLSVEAFQQLISSPDQVAGFTFNEVQSLDSIRIPMFGANFGHLSDAALNALKDTVLTNQDNLVCQVTAVEAPEIAVLKPAQVRQIGANDFDKTARIGLLSDAAWKQLMKDPAQVAGITVNEFYQPVGSKLTSIPAVKIPQMGLSIKYLSNAVLSVIPTTFTANLLNPTSPFNAITDVQLGEFDPTQIVALAGGLNGARLGFMTATQLGALSAQQVGGLTPANVRPLTAQQLASFQAATFSGFSADTKASFTSVQKSLLSPSQKTQCGC